MSNSVWGAWSCEEPSVFICAFPSFEQTNSVGSAYARKNKTTFYLREYAEKLEETDFDELLDKLDWAVEELRDALKQKEAKVIK